MARRTAVVIGGSLAGMCAARALTDVFDEVIVVDRDAYPVTVAARPGVPQGRHVHGLLERGRRDLDALFPGFRSEMLATGALALDSGLHFAVRRRLGWQERGPHGSEQLWSSRNLLEFVVRRLLRAQARVQLLERTRVTGLSVRETPHRHVTGVLVRTADAEQRELRADLIVDASGRGTHIDTWLRERGVAAPIQEVVDAHVTYASRLYQAPRRRPAWLWWKGLSVEGQAPDLPRAGVVVPLEADRWLITLGGIAGTVAPTDEADFTEYMHSLSSPALAQAVALATPLSDISGSRRLENVRRRYDQWTGDLRGFIAVGDAACSLNPIYGQGMSVAAASAVVLREMLLCDDPGIAGFEARFFARQAALVHTPWRLATRADFVWPTTEGVRPKPTPVVGAYVKLALKSAHFDAAIRRKVMPIFDLTGSMGLLFRPALVAAVLRSSARRKLRARLSGHARIPDLPPMPSLAQPERDERATRRSARQPGRSIGRAG